MYFQHRVWRFDCQGSCLRVTINWKQFHDLMKLSWNPSVQSPHRDGWTKMRSADVDVFFEAYEISHRVIKTANINSAERNDDRGLWNKHLRDLTREGFPRSRLRSFVQILLLNICFEITAWIDSQFVSVKDRRFVANCQPRNEWHHASRFKHIFWQTIEQWIDPHCQCRTVWVNSCREATKNFVQLETEMSDQVKRYMRKQKSSCIEILRSFHAAWQLFT